MPGLWGKHSRETGQEKMGIINMQNKFEQDTLLTISHKVKLTTKNVINPDKSAFFSAIIVKTRGLKSYIIPHHKLG